MRGEIGDNELGTVGSESQATEFGRGRRTAGRFDSSPVKSSGDKIENVDMINVAEIEPLARLIVNNEFVESWFRVEILALQILK